MNILVLSPHPDDESIGCGGTILKHVAQGDSIEVIFLTSGENGGHGKSRELTLAIREQEARNAAAILGIHQIHFWREPDGELATSEDNIGRLQTAILNSEPGVIYAPHRLEQHPDHKATAIILDIALKRIDGAVKNITSWYYEVWTPIQEIRHIVDISDFIALKKQAISAHQSQCSVLKFDEAILGLNRYRGEMHSWPGGDYAEVFSER